MELEPKTIRVMGALMEKARTTPESYPLTLNSLVHACNQKTSRDPVTDYDEDEVLGALDALREMGLVMRVDLAGSRTAKFRENLSAQWELDAEEYALLATLFLRGAQTPGQLRQRSDRMHPFADLQQVNDCLQRMQDREEEPLCLVRSLERTAGTKEIRWEHTFLPESAPAVGIMEETPLAPASIEEQPASRIDQLEERLAAVENRLKAVEELLHELND
ncbi:MAG: YceH family protein [Puniceicoccaceae bacterium]